MKYICSCGFQADDWGVFLKHVFSDEGIKKSHYILFQEDQTNRAR